MGRRRFSAEVLTCAEGLSALEDFIRNCSSSVPLPESLADSVLLAAVECFENIAGHSVPAVSGKETGEGFLFPRFSVTVSLEAAPGKPVRLVFLYRPPGKAGVFRSRKKTAEKLRRLSGEAGDSFPVYDKEGKRWRNLGLKMCKNLAQEVEYKCGLFRNKIILLF